jgi:hypothetical protein
MANKKILWGMLALALTFGLAVIGCPNETDDNNGGGDSALNGTWVSGSGASQIEVKLENGKFEYSSMMKGTYTTASGKLTMKVTHMYGDMMGLESKWYSKDELKTAMGQTGIPDEYIEESVAEIFTEQTGNYTLSGDTLTITMEEGSATTFTRKK